MQPGNQEALSHNASHPDRIALFQRRLARLPSPTAVRATDVTKQVQPETPMPSSVAIIVVPPEQKG